MATAENAKLQYEAGQTAYAMAALTDSGDKTTFAGTASPWSGRSGYEPDVRPDGLISGAAITPGSGDNHVSVATGSAYVLGVLVTVGANATLDVTKPATSAFVIYSICVGTNGVVVANKGSEHSAFGARNEPGGAPRIPVNEIELGQVRISTLEDVVITAAMISQVPGTTQERFDVPLHVETDAYAGTVTFGDAMDSIHVGPVTKNVYASYAVPSFSNIPKVKDFVAPENTRSVSSEQIYGGTVGSSSQSLGQGGFTAFLDNGITDPLVALKNENLWFKFYPDRAKSAHLMAQGYLGVARTFPAGAQIQASCTISAEAAAQEIA